LKIRLFLVFVILYILAVFGWWLYSLVDFTKNEHRHELNSLIYKCDKIKEKIIIYLYSKDARNNDIMTVMGSERTKINGIFEQLKSDYKLSADLQISENAQNFYDLVSVVPNKDEIAKIDKRFEAKLRAFYSEAIVFTASVILGVLWVFSRLESLLNLNRMQNNFLLLVTHELKTPLAGIKLSAQTLSQRKLSEDMQKQVINQTIHNSDRLNDLIDNVLLATKIDGNSYKYNMETIDIVNVIRTASQQVLVPPVFNGTIAIPNEEFLISADAISINLVFNNLFQNALKYAGEDANIRIQFQKEDNKLRITLTDDGPGILQVDKKRIFRKFYRTGDESTRKTKGTGLGLFLVKQILHFHNAKITADNNEPAGAKFTLTFKII
jgi:signal transduction histidine kinase